MFLVVWHWVLKGPRRLGMRGIGWYFAGSLLMAFSVALPVFGLHRELARHSRNEVDEPLGWVGTLSVLAVAAATIAYTVRALLAP